MPSTVRNTMTCNRNTITMQSAMMMKKTRQGLRTTNATILRLPRWLVENHVRWVDCWQEENGVEEDADAASLVGVCIAFFFREGEDHLFNVHMITALLAFVLIVDGILGYSLDRGSVFAFQHFLKFIESFVFQQRALSTESSLSFKPADAFGEFSAPTWRAMVPDSGGIANGGMQCCYCYSKIMESLFEHCSILILIFSSVPLEFLFARPTKLNIRHSSTLLSYLHDNAIY